MKIVGISGSPRKGNSEFILKEILGKLNSYNKKTILLRERTIQQCDGCMTCDDIGRCHIDDQMQPLYDQLQKADLILFATPTYFNNMSGMLKTFLDRTFPVWLSLEGKKYVIVATGEEGGDSVEGAIESLRRFCKACKMEEIAALNVQVSKPDDASKNISVKEKIKTLSEELNTVIKIGNEGKTQ